MNIELEDKVVNHLVNVAIHTLCKNNDSVVVSSDDEQDDTPKTTQAPICYKGLFINKNLLGIPNLRPLLYLLLIENSNWVHYKGNMSLSAPEVTVLNELNHNLVELARKDQVALDKLCIHLMGSIINKPSDIELLFHPVICTILTSAFVDCIPRIRAWENQITSHESGDTKSPVFKSIA